VDHFRFCGSWLSSAFCNHKKEEKKKIRNADKDRKERGKG